MRDDTQDRLIRIEGKIDTLVEYRTDHEGRLRTLERARWPLPSLSLVVAMAALVLPRLT